MIAIDVNGEPRGVAPESTLADLVQVLELGGQALALAVNRQVVPRQQWGARVLQPQDKVEIVRAIGGG